jgi:hypothetical protein
MSEHTELRNQLGRYVSNVAAEEALLDCDPAAPRWGAPDDVRVGPPLGGPVCYLEVPGLYIMHDRMRVWPVVGRTDPKVYERRRDETFVLWPVKTVRIGDLIATQPYVNAPRVAALVPVLDLTTHPVSVIDSTQGLYLMDGHHRVAAAIARGDTSIPAHVMEV